MRKALGIAIFVLICAGYSLSKIKLDEQIDSKKTLSDFRYLPSPDLAKFLSIGFKEAFSDLYWIEALNYFGEQLFRKDRSYLYLSDYIALILNLDPLFAYFYDWGSTVYIYNALPVNREALVKSIRLTNAGISSLHAYGRYNSSLIQKGAFTYALDARTPKPSVDYFEFLGRLHPGVRDMLLVGSAYAKQAGEIQRAYALREEYLAYKVFEAKTHEELQEAYSLVISSALTHKALDFVRVLRVEMEKDEELKKLIAERLRNQMSSVEEKPKPGSLPKLQNVKFESLLKVKTERNWLPPELHALLSLY